MDIVLANVSNLDFKIERDLIEQCGAIALPFYGMDKSMAAVCQSLNAKNPIACDKGVTCPFRHIRGDRTIVCKHWLRGLCKKGDQCEFLHEYDMKKMPECYFYSRFNACHNKECPFLHIDPESKVKDCPWYDRGFCRHGPHCRHRHVRRVLCMNYLAGFCTNGWNCKFMHPRFELPPLSDMSKDPNAKKMPVSHYFCELGHKASVCHKNLDTTTNDGKMQNNMMKNQFGAAAMQSPHHDAANDDDNTNISSNNNNNNADMDNNENKHKIERDENYMPNQSKQQQQQQQMPYHHHHHHHHHHHQQQQQHFQQQQSNFPKVSKPLEEITCYKCGNKGHYANKCPKGHLAFLSNQRSHK